MASAAAVTSELLDCVSCPVCMEKYDNSTHVPKLLPCEHTYCHSCLSSLSVSSYDIDITCPMCRSKHTPPAKGFTTNRAVLDMVDGLDRNTTSEVLHCADHPDKECVLLCLNCLVGLCATCMKTLRKSRHHDHELEEPAEAKVVLRQKFHRLVTSEQAALARSLSQLDDMPSSLTEIERAEAKVVAMKDSILAMIETWADNELDTLGELKNKALAARQEIEQEQYTLQAVLDAKQIDIPTLIGLITHYDTLYTRTSDQLIEEMRKQEHYSLSDRYCGLSTSLQTTLNDASKVEQKWKLQHQRNLAAKKILEVLCIPKYSQYEQQ